MYGLRKHPLSIFFINLICLFAAYYLAIFLHESGHGVSAWLSGVKDSPLDIQYEGWLFMNADELVNYGQLMRDNRGCTAAMIGIAGPLVSLLLVLMSFVVLGWQRVQRHILLFSFIYWLMIVSMIPLVQYFSVYPFAQTGDTAEFVRGLGISAWYVFIPGTIFCIYAMWRILRVEIIRAIVVLPVRTVYGQNLLLLVTLSTIFLIAYTNGYNPFVNDDVNLCSRILAIISIILVPVLFAVFNPARNWMKQAIASMTHHS